MVDLATIGFRAETSDLQTAKARLDAIKPAAEKAEKASKELATEFLNTGKGARSAIAAIDGIGVSSGKTARATDTLVGATGRARDANGRFVRTAAETAATLGRTTSAANDNAAAIGRAGAAAQAATGKFAAFGAALTRADQQVVAVGRSMVGMLAGVAGVAALGGAISGVINTTAEFQRLNSSLITVTGSASGAAQAMDQIKRFAATTPFDLQQVTEAFIRLRLLGLNATESALTSYGNTASAMGRPIMQFIEAVADATTGEFERLKEFGIKASQEQDKVSFTFQGVTTTIGKSAAEIETYLRKIGDTQFAGGMERQAATLGGALSNAGDAIANFQNSVGEGGFAGEVANASRRLGEFLAANDNVARSIGFELGQAVRDANAVLTAFSTVVTTVSNEINIVSTTVSNAFASIRSTVGEFTVAINGYFASITGASAEAAALLPNGWWEAMNQIHSFIAEGTQNVIRTFSGIPAAGHAAREALKAAFSGESVGEAFSNTFAIEQQAFVDKINGLGAAVGEAVGFHITLDEVVVDSTVHTRDLANATADARSNMVAAAPAVQAVAAATDTAGKAAQKASDSYAKQALSIDEAVGTIERQIAALGMTEGATAAAEFKARELARAWDIAREAGKDFVPQSTIDKIDEAAGSIESLTNKLNTLNEVNSAVDEFFPFDKAQREATRLNSILSDTSLNLTDIQRQAIGLKIDKAFEDATAAVDRFGKKTKDKTEEIKESMLENIGTTLFDIFTSGADSAKGFFDSLIKGFAGIGRSFAQLGQQKLMTTLFGENAAAFGASNTPQLSGMSLPSVSGNRGGGNVASSSIMGSVTTNDFRSLNDNMRSTGRNVLDLAKSFNGLNEKSSAQIINGFLSNSGTAQLDARTQAWCAAFANAALMKNGIKGTGSNMASSFMDWGLGTDNPKPGDIVVFKPQSSGTSGHVSFFDSFDKNGNVRAFGGNQGNAAKTSTYQADQVRAFRTYDEPGFQKAVSTGVQTGIKRAATDNWAGMRESDVQPMGSSGGGMGGLFGPRGQAGFSVLGAGIGAFSQGYESGSPISGGLSGAMSGFGAAGAIGSAFPALAGIAGPLGIVGGAALGILGGIFGGRKKREQEHQEKAKAWADVQPQWQAYQESLNGAGPRSGLRAYQEQMMAEQMKFQEIGGAAWKRGTGNSSEHFNEVGLKLFNEHLPKGRQRFAASFDPAREDMLAGRGLEGPFIQAQEAIIAAGEKLLLFVDDAKFVFGDTSTQATQAMEAARAQAMATLDIIKPMSQIETEVSTFEGAASSLKSILVELGMSADEASAAINGKLALAMDRLGSDLTQSLTENIEALDGKGYFIEFRSLIDNVNQTMKDITQFDLNVDTSLVDTFFKKSAQSLVDGAELTGEAFDELINKFPELAGLVNAFTAVVDNTVESVTTGLTQAEIIAQTRQNAEVQFNSALAHRTDMENALRSAYQATSSELNSTISRLQSFRDGIRSMLTSINLSDASPLSGFDQFQKAQKEFREVSALALAGDEDAQEKLVSVSQNYLDEARSYYASSEEYFAAFHEVENTLKSADAKASTQITQAEEQLASLKQQVSSLISIDEGVKSVAAAIANLAAANKAVADAQTKLNDVRNWGPDPERNKALVAGLSAAGLNYTGDFGSGGHNAWAATLSPDQLALHNQIASQYDHLLRPVTGFAMGGIVSGPGNGTSDSISAMLSNGEYVMPSSRVNGSTLPMLRDMHAGRSTSNDNSDVVQELADLKRIVQTLLMATGEGLARVAEVTERTANAAEMTSVNAKLNAQGGTRK